MAQMKLLRRVRSLCGIVVQHNVGSMVVQVQRVADRVLVLERGALVQEGAHGTLIGAEGPYRRIYGRYRAMAQVEG